MSLGRYLSSLTKPELEEIREQCNLSDDELAIFKMLSKSKSRLEICDFLGLSERTTDRRIKKLKRKVEEINGNNKARG